MSNRFSLYLTDVVIYSEHIKEVLIEVASSSAHDGWDSLVGLIMTIYHCGTDFKVLNSLVVKYDTSPDKLLHVFRIFGIISIYNGDLLSLLLVDLGRSIYQVNDIEIKRYLAELYSMVHVNVSNSAELEKLASIDTYLKSKFPLIFEYNNPPPKGKKTVNIEKGLNQKINDIVVNNTKGNMALLTTALAYDPFFTSVIHSKKLADVITLQ